MSTPERDHTRRSPSTGQVIAPMALTVLGVAGLALLTVQAILSLPDAPVRYCFELVLIATAGVIIGRRGVRASRGGTQRRFMPAAVLPAVWGSFGAIVVVHALLVLPMP